MCKQVIKLNHGSKKYKDGRDRLELLTLTLTDDIPHTGCSKHTTSASSAGMVTQLVPHRGHCLPPDIVWNTEL